MVEQIPFVVTGKADFAPVYAQIEALRLKMIQLSNQTVGTGFSKEALAGMANAEASFLKTVKSTQALQLETVKLSSATDHLTSQLVKGKFASSDYFKMWKSGAQGVQPELEKIAKAQAKIAESSIIPSSTRQGYAHIITDTQGIANATRVATIQQLAYNKAMIDASTRMLNFGKNVQWAGRQLTVGLTLPIAAAGAALGDMYYQFDKNIQMLERVYGMGGAAGQAYSKALPTPQQLTDIRNKIMDVSKAMAETYGQSAKVTAEVAVGLAQAGYMGDQLVNLTKTATQAIVLGQTDQQSAIKATISLQTAYKLSIGETADAMNFFAAAHAATSTTMADLINAIPRVGPVVANLGGTYKDTVALLAAMKQGGVSVTDGANALKTSLTRLIVPTNTAQKALAAFGIDIKGIVNRNAGDLLGTITELQTGLMKLTPLAREQAITDMFGKYQVARMTALFQNFNTAGSQSAKVMGMMGLSSKELAGIAAQQTDVLQQSQAGKAKIAWASLQANLLPIGQKFLTVGVAVLQFVDKIVEGFNKLGAIKYVILGALGGAAILGPLIMLGGLLTNLIAQIFKISQTMRIMGTGFSQANGWAKPFQGLTGAMRAFGQTFTVIDKAQLASIELADVMTGTMMTQEELLKHYTLAIQRYSDAIGGIRLSTGAVTEQMAAQETVRTPQIITSSSRLVATKAAATHGMVSPYLLGGVVKTPTSDGKNGRLRTRGLDGKLGTGVEFAHLTPFKTNVEGSNVLGRGTDPNAMLGAMGKIAMHPGYLVDEAGYGKEFNQRLQGRPAPILPVGATSEQARSVMGALYTEKEMDSDPSRVAAFRQQYAQETVMASETARLSTIKMEAMLSKKDLAEYTKIVGTAGGNVAAEDVTKFLKTKLGQDWQTIKEATAREIIRMYDSATSEAEAYFAKTGKFPASEFERLGVITSAFGEDLRVTLLETINQTDNGLLKLLTVNTIAEGDTFKKTMTDALKKKLGPGLTLITTQSTEISAIIISALEESMLALRAVAEAVATQLAAATKFAVAGAEAGIMGGVSGVTGTVGMAGKFTPKFAGGGHVAGPGTGTSDDIPAMLSNGEYVVRASAVNQYGKGFMDQLNAKKFAGGGPATPAEMAAVASADSGIISTSNVFIDPNMQSATEGFTTALKDATNATMKSTQATNQSVLAGNSLEPNAGNPAEEGKKSRFKMGGMGGMGSMGSMIGGQIVSGIMGTMASNMQSKGPSAAGQAMGDASTGMMMGSMAGWPGMLIGTALGGVFGLIKGHLDELKSKEVSRQNEIAGAYNMSADAASTLGLAVHNLGSVNLPLLTSKIQINDSVVQKLAASYSSSSDAGTKELVARVGGESAALKKLQDAQAQQQKDQGSQPNRFSSMTAASDASAVAKATAEYQAAGAASNNELNKNFLTTMLATGSTKVAGESYAGLAQAGGKSGFGVTTNISQLQQQYSGINGQSKALGDLINSASGDSKALGDIMNNVITSVSPDKWNAIAGASTKAGAALWNSANSFANLQNQIVATNPELSKYTAGLNQMGVSTGDIATAVNLYANNAFSSINEFVNAAANSQLLKGYQAAASQNAATSAASNIPSLGVSSLGSAATSGTSGGSGTSTSTEGIQQSIQDQIRSITNEMDARNANTAVIQAQINSGTTLADLQNKIAQAQGTGNLTAISAAQEQYAQQVSTQATVITNATQNAADAQTVYTLEQNLATAATHKTNAQMQTLIQKQINSLTREIDVRNRSTTLLNNQIQQQETLMNLQNDVVKSQGSGDLLGAALAQTKVNNELNKQTVTNSNDAANYRDTQIQSLLQDQIVALQAIATTAGAGNSSAGTAGGVTSAQQALIDSAGTAFTDLTNILKTSALDLKPGTTNITGTSTLAARARDDVAAIIKGGYDPQKLGKSMATEIKNSPLKTQMSKSDQSSYQTMFNTVSDAMWKANMPLTEIQGKMETLAQTPGLLGKMNDFLKPIATMTTVMGRDDKKKSGGVAIVPGDLTTALAAVFPAVDPNKIQQWTDSHPMPVKVMDAAAIAADAAKAAADKATAAAIANLPPGWMARHQQSNLAGATGGFMQAFANGSLGSVRGAGSGISDSIPAMLSHGEYVVKASSVSKLGVGVLDMINQGIMPTYKTPGAKIAVPSSSQMGNSTSSKNIQYNVNVNVAGTNASADEIAKVVISTIKAREGANLTRRSIS